jgi:hypothetical protein
VNRGITNRRPHVEALRRNLKKALADRDLEARRLAPDELIEEARSLEALGEEVPADVSAEVIGALLRAGRVREARAAADRLLTDLDPRMASRAGWICRELEAHDLAFDFFARAFPRERANPKLLTAFELVAKRSGRIAELVRLYESTLPRRRTLYGRVKRLRSAS